MKSYDGKVLDDAWVEEFFTKNGWRKDRAGADWQPAMTALEKSLTLRRGIIVTGEYGCGKTTFIRIAVRLHRILERQHPLKRWCEYTRTYENREPLEYAELLCMRQEDVEDLSPVREYNSIGRLCKGHVLIDDLGTEKFHNEYGEKYDLVGDFICRYHEQNDRRNGLMFITTNLRGEELTNRYDGRVVSRLKDLCVPLRMTGEDKREWVL